MKNDKKNNVDRLNNSRQKSELNYLMLLLWSDTVTYLYANDLTT